MNENNKVNIIRRLSRLYEKFELLFNTCLNNTPMNPISIKYKFCFESVNGPIEYKRTLKTYCKKKDKLLRQIYWRLYESIVYEPIINNNILNKNIMDKDIFMELINSSILKCYYVIGIEDNGQTGKININELIESLNMINETILNTNIKLTYLYLINEIDKTNLLVTKFELELEQNDKFCFD